MNLIKTFLLLGFLQSILIAFALFRIKGKRLPNALLAFHLLSWGLMCFYRYSSFQKKDFLLAYHFTLKFNYVVETVMFVFAFLYIKYLATEEKHFSKKDYLHFIPALVTFILLIPFFVMPVQQKVQVHMARVDEYYQILEFVLFFVSIIQGILYFAFSFKYIKQYHLKLKENYSNTSVRTIYWMQIMLGGVLSMLIFGLAGVFLGHRTQIIYNTMYFIVGLSIYVVAYYMLIQNSLFSNMYDSDVVIPNLAYSDTESDLKLYNQAGGLDVMYSKTIIQELERIMNEERIFLFHDLSLNSVAQRINIPKQHISEVLNKTLGTNFFDYVNTYRVEEAKRKLKDKAMEKYTLIALGIESGFNSKASFYRNFRKYENMTPLEFKQQIDKNQELEPIHS